MQRIGKQLFCYRYLIGIIIFIACVGLELHGSSLNIWLQWLPGGQQNNELIFGKLRAIRSDEWAVFTPLTLAQRYNPLGAYSYFSTIVRGGITDCFIVYGQPVWNPMMIFRIFQVGFLFLTAGQGMAFFWVGRGIVLFLISVEMGILLTNGNKFLSVAFAAMMLFAPMVQWWYAINGLVEMLIAGQLAVFAVYQYMRTTRYFIRFLSTLVLVWCGGTYILTFYPAWMVPFAYVWLVLLISVILKNKNTFQWIWKYDSLLVILFLALLGGCMFYTFDKSWDCIQAVLNSSYPGKRVSTGGQVAWTSLLSGSNLFFPYRTEMIPFLRRAEMPVCEFALFMDFFPIGTLFAIYAMIKRKRVDSCLIGLFVIDFLFIAYTVWGFPEWLAKLTLLSFSSSNRVAETVSFVRLLELFCAIGLYSRYKPLVRKKRVQHYIGAVVQMGIIAGIAMIMGIVNHTILPDYLWKKDVIVIVAIFFVVGWLVWHSDRIYMTGLFSCFCIGISLIAGGYVNPVQKGLDQVQNNPLLVQMKQIDLTDSGMWITEGMEFPYGNIPLLAGVSSLNATNVYPNLNEWAILDPYGTQKEIYNRYAHIQVVLTNEPTSFLLARMDEFIVKLNPDDLNKVGAKYILSRRDLTQFNRDTCQFVLAAQVEDYRVYKIITN